METGAILAIVGSNVVIFMTMIGITIKLHLNSINCIRSIEAEMKDFHARLCVIEENRK